MRLPPTERGVTNDIRCRAMAIGGAVVLTRYHFTSKILKTNEMSAGSCPF
jgi:hypothetical protein